MIDYNEVHRMNILLIGAGRVGYGIAKGLAFDDHDVTVIDNSPTAIKRIGDRLDVKAILGTGTDPAVLHEANAYSADMIVAVTSCDETNIIACQIAEFLYKITSKIVRISSPNYNNYQQLFDQNGFDIDLVISPEKEAIDAVMRNITAQGISDLCALVNGQIFVASVVCSKNAPVVNVKIHLLSTVDANLDIAVLFIERNDVCFIPIESDILLNEDVIYFVVEAQKLQEVLTVFCCDDDDCNNVVFIGGSDLAFQIARAIAASDLQINIKLVEKDSKRAEFLSENLNNVEVIYGDAFDIETLDGASIKSSDCVIASTDDDKTNIISCLLAKKYGAKRVATLLNDLSYSKIIQSIGINTIIDPRQEAIFNALRYIHKGGIDVVKISSDGRIYIVSVDVLDNSFAVGAFINTVCTKGEVQIATLIRNTTTYINPHNLIINAGDKIVLVVGKTALKRIEKFFAVTPKYLA
jgi:trk system potassium uptake protein TrkA